MFIEYEVTNNSLYEVIEKHGVIHQSNYLKLQELVQKLVKICSMYQVNTTSDTIAMLNSPNIASV